MLVALEALVYKVWSVLRVLWPVITVKRITPIFKIIIGIWFRDIHWTFMRYSWNIKKTIFSVTRTPSPRPSSSSSGSSTATHWRPSRGSRLLAWPQWATSGSQMSLRSGDLASEFLGDHHESLVGGAITILKNMSSSMGRMIRLFPIYGKIEHVLNHQRDHDLIGEKDWKMMDDDQRRQWKWMFVFFWVHQPPTKHIDGFDTPALSRLKNVALPLATQTCKAPTRMVINQLRPVVRLGFCLGMPGANKSIRLFWSDWAGGLILSAKSRQHTPKSWWGPLMSYDEHFRKGIIIIGNVSPGLINT